MSKSLLVQALQPVGVRKDGRPILPILGGADDDPAAHPSAPAPEPTPKFTQADLDRIAAREKDQGQRAGQRQVAVDLGFESPDQLAAFVKAQREAEEARLSEEQKRQRELEQREAALAAREREAKTAIRTAAIRGVLVQLGAIDDNDLADAEALIQVAEDADAAAIKAAAEALKTRRPELFAATHKTAPDGSPVRTPPGRPSAPPPVFGAGGLEMARRRGLIKDEAKS